MTDQEINATIAEECGWGNVGVSEDGFLMGVEPLDGAELTIPDYCHNLNEMHDAEWCFFGDWDNNQATDKQFDYLKTLHFVCGNGSSVCSTARQRAEAFLRTIGKWKE